MEPKDYYRKIIDEITEQDVRSVAQILIRHIGEENSIELRDLANMIYGTYNENTERKLRYILEKLVTDYGIPVGARSGKSGRWLCKGRDEIEKVLSDLKARKEALNIRIERLEKLGNQLEYGQRPLFAKPLLLCER